MITSFFKDISQYNYIGSSSSNKVGYKNYNPDELVMGKRLEEHLRFAIAYWHSFGWEGNDPFGTGTFERPWHPQDCMENARLKADAAFDMFSILGQPYFCWHDVDLRPEQENLKDNMSTLDEITDYVGQKMEAVGTKLLWGTANMFTHKRWMAGASTNPDPDIFAFAAATVKSCIDATHKLSGENYVLWGGREGYETLLNTNLDLELDHMGRFLNMVVDYKYKIGFKGTILVEPKPQEPSKHQYDYDAATCIGFLRKYGLENEVKLNLEQGHAILAGHSFEHEVAFAISEGMFGSIDMNRNDYQSGWDTDQFPNNVPEIALVYYHIIKSGGFSTGGTNFDAKLRRQSLDPQDLIEAHAGAMDICARGFKAAVLMIADGKLEKALKARYSKWRSQKAKDLLESDLDTITEHLLREGVNPVPKSGRQEILENYVNLFV